MTAQTTEPNVRVDLARIEANPDFIRELESPTSDEQLLAVGLKPSLIKGFIHMACADARLLALQGDGDLIEFYEHPTHDELLMATTSSPTAIKKIANPPPSILANHFFHWHKLLF